MVRIKCTVSKEEEIKEKTPDLPSEESSSVSSPEKTPEPPKEEEKKKKKKKRDEDWNWSEEDERKVQSNSLLTKDLISSLQ